MSQHCWADEYPDRGRTELQKGRRSFGPFRMELGGSLPSLTLSYETFGEFRGDNAVLVCHALTGDSHVSRGESGVPGWWEDVVGPGRPVDTSRYFVLCVDVPGSCHGSTGPSSSDPRTGRPYGPTFPALTIRDMVRASRRLASSLGIRRFRAIIGGSMGGMQVLEWAVTYPGSADVYVPIATPAAHTATAIGYHEVMRQAIVGDPGWRGGWYYGTAGPGAGLATARMLAMLTYRSDASLEARFGRQWTGEALRGTLPLVDGVPFQIQSYLRHQGRKLVERFDANSYLYLTQAMDLFDLAWGRGSLRQALGRIRGRVVLVGIDSDVLYSTEHIQALERELRGAGIEVDYREISSPYGHDAFLLEGEQVGDVLREALEQGEVEGRGR